MTKNIGTDAEINQIRLKEQVANPASPSSGYAYLYTKSDGVYYKDSAGNVVGPFSASPADITNLPASETDTTLVLAPNGTGGVGFRADSGITMNQADPYGLFHRLDAANADDDEFDDASIDAGWTQVTPTGVVTWVEANNVLSAAFNGQSANDICAILKATTLADGEYYETCLRTVTKKLTTYTMTGLVISNGVLTTSSAMALILYLDNVADELNCELWTGTLTNMTSGGAGFMFSSGQVAGRLRPRIKRNSATSFSWLMGDETGAQFNAFSALTVNPGFTPTHAGLFVSVWGGTHSALCAFDYFRKI